MVYEGYCQHSAGIITTNEILSLKGIFLLEDKKNGSFKKVSIKENKITAQSSLNDDSLFVVGNRTLKKVYNSGVLKKENSLSDEYYLRTNFFAINGIGYDSRQNAWDNFENLFVYVKEAIQKQFPEDTISTELIFNKTSRNKFTDIVQTIYNMVVDAGPDISVLGLGVFLYMSYEELKIQFAAQFNPVLEEIINYRDKLWNEIIESNEKTDADLKSELANCANNKSRALVLGHSQGGMYTYKAFNSFPDSVREHFYSFNVAVPTDKNPDWYLINDNDLIVNAARVLLGTIPEGESNGPVDGEECESNNFTHHAWNESYYKPCLQSYAKINAAIEKAIRTVTYWEKEKKNAMYQLVWYNSAAQTTIEIAKADGSFATLGTYHGYHVTDPTIKTVPDVLLQDGVPVLRVKSYHHESWWGPYLSTDPGFFEIISNDDGSLTYLMSDAWSPYSYDDAELSIALTVE